MYIPSFPFSFYIRVLVYTDFFKSQNGNNICNLIFFTVARSLHTEYKRFYRDLLTEWRQTYGRFIWNGIPQNHTGVSFTLWSQIIYGHRTASISTNILRSYGARTAPGRRQKESYDFYQCLDILWCPAKFRYMYYRYLKFHGARTAFGMVIEGEMTSAGHRTTPGWRLHSSDRHRTIFV